MNLLLIEATYNYGPLKTMIDPHFPLGLGYIAAFMREKGYNVRLILGNTPEQIQAELNTFQPQVVGISCMTPTFPEAVSICRTVKENSQAMTVLGGPHVSALRGEILQSQPQVDFVVYGEGEQTFWELCRVLEQGGDLSGVDGLVYRHSNGQVNINQPRALIRDVDSLPFPARDLVDLKLFGVHRYVGMGKRSATIITSRGCPFNCAFCASHLTMGRGYRYRSAANVIAEIDELVQNYGINHIYFEDDTFTVEPNRAKEICQQLLERNYQLTWNCLSRVGNMTEELARLMRRAGCCMVAFGVESGSPEILKKIHKKTTLEQVESAVIACYRAGLRSQCTFILGFPFDTYETMWNALHYAQRLSPTLVIFFCLIPYPGTELFKYLPPGQYPQKLADWKKFSNFCTEISMMPGLSGKRLARIADICHLRFYLRPRQLYRMLRTLYSMGEIFSFLVCGWEMMRNAARSIWGRESQGDQACSADRVRE